MRAPSVDISVDDLLYFFSLGHLKFLSVFTSSRCLVNTHCLGFPPGKASPGRKEGRFAASGVFKPTT